MWYRGIYYPDISKPSCIAHKICAFVFSNTQRTSVTAENCYFMMTSSNRNIFRVTGLLWGEFTGHRWIPLTKASDVEHWCFLWSAPWINGWVNNRVAGDLRRHRAHYDVMFFDKILVSLGYVMKQEALTHWGRVIHICVSKLDHNCFTQRPVACSAPSYYLNYCKL